MYLSELFLKSLNGDKAALSALIKCDLELKKRLNNRLEEQDIINHFFCEDTELSRERYAELMDFMDVYQEVDYEVSEKEKEENDIWILAIIEEVEGCYQILRCEELTEQWSEEKKEDLLLLCREITEISNGKQITF